MRRLIPLLFLAARVHAGTAEALDEYFTRATAHGFSGAVIVARGEQIILRKGYGLADRRARVAARPDTAFNIASVDKQFIAAGILRLEELGKLRTTETLERFFDDVPDDKKGITLHQVLSQTAGLPDVYWDEYETLTRAAFLALVFREQRLLALPGTQHAYASVNFTLLEAVIERVTGAPFERFLRDELWLPAGMRFTGVRLPEWDRNNVGRSHLWTMPDNVLRGSSRFTDPLLRPEAWQVIVSTADDLHRWYLALRGGRVLTAASRQKLFTPVLSDYAYGWRVERTSRHTKLIYHNGGSGFGSVATFRWFVDEDVFVAVLNNSAITGLLADFYGADVEHILFGGPVILPPAATALDDAAAAKLAGTYRFPNGAMLEVLRAPDNGPLIARTRDVEAMTALRLGGSDDGTLPPDAVVHDIVGAWSRGEFTPPPRWSEPGWTADGLKSWAERLWKDNAERFGAYRGVATIHYRAAVVGGVPQRWSFVKVRFEKGELMLRVMHVPSGHVLFDLIRSADGAEAVLAPSPSGGFTTWDCRFGSVVKLEASGANLKLTGSGGSVTAMRVNGK